MTQLTFYGGVTEIGGNKILLEDKGTRIWLDFGMSFGGAGNFYSEFLGPKKCNGVGDYIALGLAPDLKGLYRPDYVNKLHREPEERAFDGILLSHAHFDHSGYFSLLRADIPIYCSQGSWCVMNMLDTTSVMGEFLRQKRSFKFVRKKTKDELKRLDVREPEGSVNRDIRVVEDGKQFEIGELKVTPMKVDHSLPGAFAYAIETSEGNIIYTGDFRFHGLRESETRKFVERSAGFEPVGLICEGTRIDSKVTETEKDVYDGVTKFAKDSESLVVCNFPIRDTDRMKTFLQAANDNGRKLAVSMRQALLLKTFEEKNQDAPKLKDVAVYIQRKSWGLVTEKDFTRFVDPENIELLVGGEEHKLMHGDYEWWEHQFVDLKNAVTCDDINKNQEDYVWRADFYELKELIDVKPAAGTKYVWSVTEPFDLKMREQQHVVYNWLNHFGIKKVIHKHVSGHANQLDLVETISTIKPKTYFPVHTEHPQKLKKFRPVRVKKGKAYSV